MPRAAGGQWVLAISTWEVTAGVALSPGGSVTQLQLRANMKTDDSVSPKLYFNLNYRASQIFSRN